MKLIDKIKYYNSEYRKGTPVISDQEYDKLIEELKSETPDNSWFDNIEPAPISNGRKRKLPLPMKSLNKVKTIPEISQWIKSLGLKEDTEVLIMPKFDGLSLLVNENTGEAYSRGGSDNEGQDCSAHFKSLNQKDSASFPYTFGEFLIDNASWNTHFKGKVSPLTGKEYRSPRNTAAGMLNQDEPNENIKYAYLYRYGTDMESMKKYKSYFYFLYVLHIRYGQKLLFETRKANDINAGRMKELFIMYRDLYPIDGLVIYIDDISLWEKIGRHKTTGNPMYAIAYKPSDFQDTFETKVKGISWNISKSGYLKPVVNIDTVDTGDCNMDNPTGYNAKFIKENKIANGAYIVVTRSGGVIPKILDTIYPAKQSEIDKLWASLSLCPVCGCSTEWNDSHTELMCTNSSCDGIRLAKIIFFFMTCGYDNVGEETFKKLYDAGFNSIHKILNIDRADILDIDTFGESIADTILGNNNRIKMGVDAYKLMHASDLFKGLGEVKLKSVIESLSSNDEDIFNFCTGHVDMNKIYLFDTPITYKNFYFGFYKYANFLIENDLHPIIPKKIIIAEGSMSGIKVCFSGIRDKELENSISNLGGSVVSGVSKNTTLLVVKDKNDSTSKIEKAKYLGISILNIDEFNDKYINCVN